MLLPGTNAVVVEAFNRFKVSNAWIPNFMFSIEVCVCDLDNNFGCR